MEYLIPYSFMQESLPKHYQLNFIYFYRFFIKGFTKLETSLTNKLWQKLWTNLNMQLFWNKIVRIHILHSIQ